MHLFLFVAFMYFMCSCPALARTIEVAITGNDQQPGTHEQPLRSISKALSVAGAGDTVMIQAGTYREGLLTIKQGGAKGAPLVIEGAPGAEAMIKGSEVVTGWRDAGEGLWKIDNWPVNSQQLFMEGQPLQQIGSRSTFNTGKHVVLPPVGKDLGDVRAGSFYYDLEDRVLYCMLPDKSDPNRHMMEASVADFLIDAKEGTKYVVIRNLTFMHNNQSSKSRGSALLHIRGAEWLVEDCTFMYGDFDGIGISGDSHTVRFCKFLNNGDEGLGISGSDSAHYSERFEGRAPQNILLEDLVVTGNNYRRFDAGWHAGGMKLIPSVRGVTVRRCYVANNFGPGIWFDSSSGSNVIEDNFVLNNQTGIFYEVSLPAPGDTFGARISNNRVVGNHAQGIYVSASNGAIVENNTCHANRWGIVLHGMPRREFGTEMSLKGNDVRNNIVDGLDAALILFAGRNSSANNIDSNFYAFDKNGGQSKACPTVGFGIVVNSGYKITRCTLAELNKVYGFESHGSAGDPKWINAEEYDFRPDQGSPAIGKGWLSR